MALRYAKWIWGGLCVGVAPLVVIELSAFMSIDGHSGPALPLFILAAIAVWAAGLGLLYLAEWGFRRRAPSREEL